MPEGNPLKISELIDFGNLSDLDKGIKAISELNRELKKVVDTLNKNGAKTQKELIGIGESIDKLATGTDEGRQALARMAAEFDKSEASLKENNKLLRQYEKAIAKLEKELEGLRRAQSGAAKSTNQLEKAIEKKNFATTQEAQELAKVRAETNRINKENREQARLTTAVEGSYEKLSIQLNIARNRYKDLAVAEKSASKEGRELLRDIQKLDRELKQVDRTVGQSFRNVGNYRSAFDGLGQSLLAATPFALGAAGAVDLLSEGLRKGFEVNRAFTLELAKVQGITGAVGEDFNSLREDALRLGESTQFTAAQVASLQTEFGKLGFATDEILNATEATLNLAIATQSDLAESAAVAGNVIRAFGLDASETARVTDVLTESFTASALDLENFRESIKLVAPISKAANVSLEQTTALLGKLADAGLQGSIAGTSLRNLLTRLTDPTSELARELGFTVSNSEDLVRAFQELQKGNIDLAKATQLTDARSKAAFLTFVNGIQSVEDLTDQLEKAEVSAAQLAATIGDTLDGDVKRLESAFEGILLEGGVLNEVFREIIQSATDLVNVVKELEDPLSDLNKELSELSEELGFANTEISASDLILGSFTGKVDGLIQTLSAQIKVLTAVADVYNKYVRILKTAEERTGLTESSIERLNSVVEESISIYNNVSEALSDAVLILSLFGNTSEKVGKLAKPIIDSISESIKSLKNEANEAFTTIKTLASVFGILDDRTEKTRKEINKTKEEISETETELDKLTGTINQSPNSFDRFTKNIINLGDAINDVDLTKLIIDLDNLDKKFSEIALDREIDFSADVSRSQSLIASSILETRENINNRIIELEKEKANTRLSIEEDLIDKEIERLNIRLDNLDFIDAIEEQISEDNTARRLNEITSERDFISERIKLLQDFADKKEGIDDEVLQKETQLAQERLRLEELLRQQQLDPDNQVLDKEIENLEKKVDLTEDQLDVLKDVQSQRIDGLQEIRDLEIENQELIREEQQITYDQNKKFLEREIQIRKELAQREEDNQRTIQKSLLNGIQANIDARAQQQLQLAQTEQERERIAQRQLRSQLALVGVETYLTSLKFYQTQLEQQKLAKVSKDALINPTQLALRDAAVAVSSGILSQGFSEGGYTGDGGKHQVMERVFHGGEYVVNKEETAKLGLRGVKGGEAVDHLSKVFSVPEMNTTYDQISKDINITNLTEKTEIDYNKLASAIASKMPKLDVVREIGGHLAIVEQVGSKKEKTLFKNKNRAL